MSGPGGSSRKRNNEGGEGISAVEKLYKRNQESYYSAGGFDEDDDAQQEIRERITEAKHRKFGSSLPNVAPPDDCIECAKPLLESFLWDSYNHPVCDVCRDDKGTHKLISRTEAKKLFLLKDEDFDIRKPILRYISRKNPHNPRYGDMKLYLKSQIEVRMLEIYGSWEKFEDAKEQRIAQRDAREEKSFEKKIKKMRMEMRTTAKYKRNIKPSKHEHTYGEETHDAKTDVYSQTCTSCGFKMTFEKM
ncbi:hypothetical protein L596_002419 [Steinernema carpocapsae]|uniref:XPA C-terminal domain-containing protein n=1 Tax=Steinernema carpocapsae TaxID=34508 RepID=A0A4U8UPG3_STECR|nr:hypothetical protein L596_002419 [Steinernema carpocapsae]